MKYTFLLFVAIFLPAMTHAEVIFSEIAWMGTTEDANNEWIEIYNFSSTPTDLTGWTLSDGNSLNIELSGTMPPHGVFLLERTDDTSVPSIPADIIYTGALANTGATLTIRDVGGNIVGTPLVGGENWVNIGGNNEFKYTAQSTRTGTWVTGTPTPKAPNIEEDELPDDAELASKSNSSSGGGGPVKSKPSTPSAPVDQELTLSIVAPDVAYVHEEIMFEPLATGIGKTTLNSLKYYWNFGDLSTASGKIETHAYRHPGEYTVAVSAEFGEQHAEALHEIRILPTSLSMTETERGDMVLKNNASQEVDLWGFVLRGTKPFTFPRLSILKGGGTLLIPKEAFGGYVQEIALHDTRNMPVFSLSRAQTTLALTAPRTQPTVAYQTTRVNEGGGEGMEKRNETTVEEGGVIQIGSVVEEKKEGVLARLFKKIGSLFRI